MKLKELGARILHAISVPRCISCKERLSYGEKAFCESCYAVFCEAKTRNCAKCARPLPECFCTNDHLKAHFVKGLSKLYRYLPNKEVGAPENLLIYALKREEREDVVVRCAVELRAAISNSLTIDEGFVFTNVPRRRDAVLNFGTDHAARLAKCLAKSFGVKYVSLLKSRARRPQKRLDRIERLKNAKFFIKRPIDLTGKSVIIVDDVVTSGSSMGAAATLVRSLGTKKIYGACLGIAYRD